MTVPHPDPELLALAALPAEPDDPAVEAHLRGCAVCRAEVADLRRTVELAREGAGGSLPAPPPRVWLGIAAELGLSGETNGQVHSAPDVPAPDLRAPDVSASDVPAPAAPPDDLTERDDPPAVAPPAPVAGGARRSTRPPGRHASGRPAARRPRRVLVPLAAAVLGVVAGLGIGRGLEPGPAPAPAPVAQLAPVGGLDPAASGSVAMAGAGAERQMVVQVRGVTDIPDGDHLEAWLMDTSGTRLVPLGALAGGNGEFHGTFALPEGVPLGEFGLVDVSAERWDGNPAHSAVSVLRGDYLS